MGEIDLTDPYAVNETLKEKNRAIAALTREVAGLRAALEPFVRHWNDDTAAVFAGIRDDVYVRSDATAGMMRAARAALAATTDTKEMTDG